MALRARYVSAGAFEKRAPAPRIHTLFQLSISGLVQPGMPLTDTAYTRQIHKLAANRIILNSNLRI